MHEARTAPIVEYVWVVVSVPGLPTFFSIVWVPPSPNVNAAAVMSPSESTPLQLKETVTGDVAVEISFESMTQVGIAFCPDGTWVGVGVDVAPGIWVGVRVSVGVTPLPV